MADFDLGSVGYDVEIRGASQAISDLRTIDSNFKTLTKDANAFKQTTVMDAVVNKLSKVEQGTTTWINLESRRQSLALAGARFEMSTTNGQLRALGQKIAMMNRVAAVEAQTAAQAKQDEMDQIRLIGQRIALMKRSGGFGGYSGLEDLGNQAQIATGKMSRFSMVTQQAGYQAGDFLVQVQSGTNAFVAFGQQATQMVGLISLFGDKLKYAMPLMLGLSIAVPILTAIGAYWQRTNKQVDEYADSLKRATDEQKKLNDETLKLKFPSVGDQLKDELKAAKKAMDDFLATSADPSVLLGQGAAGGIDISSWFSDDDQEKFAKLKKSYEDLIQAKKAYDNQSAISDATQLQNQIKLQAIDEKRKDYLEHEANMQKEINHQYQVYYDSISKGGFVMQGTASYWSDIKIYADSAAKGGNALLTAAQNMQGPFASIAGFAANIAANMWAAAGQQQPSALAAYNAKGPLYAGMAGRGIPTSAPVNAPWKPKPGGSGSGGGGGSTTDPVAELQKQIALTKELYNKTDAQKQVIQALGVEWVKSHDKIANALIDEIQKQNELNEKTKQQEEIWGSVSSSMADGLMAMVEGTKSVENAFKEMAYNVVEELYKVLVVQQMVSSMGTLMGGSGGGASLIGSFTHMLTGKAVGGSVTAGQPYIVGEQGPEIIVPSTSGKVLTNSQSSSAMSGSSSGSVTVQNNITVTGSDAAMVRQTVVQMLPQITQASMNGIIDAKRRGGRVGNVFN
jgi:hypothetical protein